MKNILVTGGAGFIGSHLVERLLGEENWRVTVVDDFNDFYQPALKRRNLACALENPNFELIETSICDSVNLRAVFRRARFDAVVHLAARAGVRPSLVSPQLYVETNVAGTLNLLELAREFRVEQFVFGSSSSVYGADCQTPFRETDATARPISPYAATKAAGELLCHTYAHLYCLRAVCLRFFTVYGARQRPDLAIHKFADAICRNQPLTVYGDGSTRRDYTYIDDIVAGVRAAIDFEQSDFEIINLGESRTIELGELIVLLEQSLGKKAIVEFLPEQPGDVPLTFADIEKARRLLDYNPQTKIETGIEHFVRWHRQTRAFM